MAVKSMLKGKTILLGVSGGIAAYKAASLCSALVQGGAEVKVIMTKGATEFITPLTFQTISRNPVYSDTFDERDPSVVSHIDLADSADLVVIAPATANVIAKMAHGLADDMLSTTLLATMAPILVAPAMNVHMYDHPAVQENMEILRKRGIQIIDPGEGQLACGYVGKGRLAEPETIYQVIGQHFETHSLLSGKKLLVTAGGTIERIDPVRYLTNDSSGKMGFAIAREAQEMGADVTLIAANTNLPAPKGVRIISVVSAQEMYDAVMERMGTMDIIVKAAAVADYRPAKTEMQKIKKKEASLTITLEKTVDILKEIGERKINQFVIGFAAETEQLERFAMEKLRSKNCDLLIANDVSAQGVGFGSDANAVSIYNKDGLVEVLPVQSKLKVAARILTITAERLSYGGRD
jgi:phosphopantothenoylcysteine decarboxylase/phosphopantothenate--cysteine ligase